MNTELDIALNKLRAEILANGSAELLLKFDYAKERFHQPVSVIALSSTGSFLGVLHNLGSAKMLEIYKTEVIPHLTIKHSTPTEDMIWLVWLGFLVYAGYKIVTL